ncbi:MAG TPA: hypothetical protein VMN39_04870, partial [Longimicrobiaceae bacterium]|nr:hypothetical protein [Longimicrobiaceae bacterium]
MASSSSDDADVNELATPGLTTGAAMETTSQTDTIKTKLERNVRAVTLRPSVGQGTATTTALLGEDLNCEIRDGAVTLHAGMTEKYGGDGSAPNPGVLGRSALASCLVIGYAMWAA